MRDIDRDGMLLCNIQGSIFEKSIKEYGTSSPVFVRRFMNSKVAETMDGKGFLNRPFSETNAFEALDEEYGKSKYGSVSYTPSIMFLIGYLYRYWAYTYEIPSKRIYRTISARELRDLYTAYHSLDPSNAIRRILEAKGISEAPDYSIERGVKLLRKIRSNGSNTTDKSKADSQQDSDDQRQHQGIC